VSSPTVITIQGRDRNNDEPLDEWVITESGNMQNFISQYMYRFANVDMSSLRIEIANPPHVKTILDQLSIVPEVTEVEKETNGDG
jgi:hypothetical protein